MPITNWTNATDITAILAEANTQTSGYFWTSINFMVFMVLFITISGMAGWEAGLMTAGFIGLLMSIFLTYAGLQAPWIMGSYIGIMIILFIYVMWSNRYD